MSNGNHDWREVSNSEPCPICEKPDWCGVAGPEGSPEVCRCMRVESENRCKDGGHLHFFRERALSTYTDSPRTREKRKSVDANKGKSPKQRFPTAAAAVAHLEAKFGKPAVTFTYPSDAGEPLGLVARFDHPTGKKDIFPVSRNGSGWVIAAMAEPRPLFHLPEVVHATRVVVVEGEPAANALANLGIVATTSPGGALAGGKADWSPLAGKLVVIWRDHDENGEKYEAEVLQQLQSLSPPPEVRIIEPLPEWRPKYDAANFVEEGGSRSDVEKLIEQAEPVEFGEPHRAIIPFRPFPLDVLPAPLADYARAVAETIGVDSSMAAVPLLVGIAGAVGLARSIEIKRGFTQPSILWAGVVAESGTGKSPTAKEVLRAVEERDSLAHRKRQQIVEQHKQDMKVYEADEAAWKAQRRSKTGTSEPPPEKPELPPYERFTVADVTMERLVEMLAENPRGFLMHVDELSGMLAGLDRYSSSKGYERGQYLSAWDGGKLTHDRKVSASAYCERSRFSIYGGLQPFLVPKIISTDDVASGLTPRFLWCAPPTRALRFNEGTIPPDLESVPVAMFGRLYSLEPEVGADGEGHEYLRPSLVYITAGARREFERFQNANADIADDSPAGVKAAVAKLPMQLARLALVLHLADEACNLPVHPEVSAETMQRAIRLVEWFRHEALRFYGIYSESDEDREARELIEWIQRRGGEIATRELVQRNRRFANTAEAEAALNDLAKRGFGQWKVLPTATKQKRVFQLTPPPASTDSPKQRETSENVYVDNVDNPESDDPMEGHEWTPV